MENKFREHTTLLKTNKIALIHILEIIANLVDATERYDHFIGNEDIRTNITNQMVLKQAYFLDHLTSILSVEDNFAVFSSHYKFYFGGAY